MVSFFWLCVGIAALIAFPIVLFLAWVGWRFGDPRDAFKPPKPPKQD